MSKVVVRLNTKLREKKLGFYDFKGKQDIKHKEGEDTITIELTPFVRNKIQSGEIEVVSHVSEEKPKEEAEQKPKTEEEPKGK